MATGRTTSKFVRVYGNGYELCPYTRSIGPLSTAFDMADLTTMCDSAKGYLPAACNINIGTLNGVMDTTATTGLHIIASTIRAWDIMIPIGIRAAPAAGDPVFMGKFYQSGYQASEDGGAVVVSVPFEQYDGSDLINYSKGWGVLLHPLGAETAANTGTGVDGGAATTKGGYLMYQISACAGTGTATVSVDDSANGTDFLALSGATSGAIAHTAIPCAGIIQLGTTATVRQHLRWQLALDTLTSATFALAFVRG